MFGFRQVHRSEVLGALEKLNPHKATGYDLVLPKVLRMVADEVDSPLTHIYTQQLSLIFQTCFDGLSFCPFTYKLGLIKTLIHRTFKINNTWMGFHTDLQKLSVILRRNLFPENLINKYISKYIQTAVKGGKTQPYSGVEPQETRKSFFKTPYVMI